MGAYKKLWGIVPLAIVLAIAFCGVFVAMPQLAQADDVADQEAGQATEVGGDDQEEPSEPAESQDVDDPEPSVSSESAASSASSSGAASQAAPSESKPNDLGQKPSSSAKKKSSVNKQADGYGIWIQGTQVTSDNASDVLGDGSKSVVYDDSKKTLTLKDAKLKCGESLISDSPAAAISVYRTDELTIVLEGTSAAIEGTESGQFGVESVAGLYVGNTGKVTVSGSGTLKLDVKNAVSSADKVNVYGICVDKSATLTIGGNAKVSATAGAAKGGEKSYGVKGSVKVSSMAVLTAIGEDQALESTPDIKDSTVGGALINKDAKADGRSIWDGEKALASSEVKYVRIPGVHHTAAKAATCTADGNIEFWYDGVEEKYYSDSSLTTEVAKDKTTVAALGHSWDKGKVTKAPTATKAGVRTYTCTRCKETKTEKIPKTGIKYTVTAGANGTWTKGTQATLNFTFKRSALENNQDTTFKHFTGIKVDNKVVDKSNYTYQSGSVIIKLKPTYLEKLSTGQHTISASFNDYDGKAPSTNFTVKANSSNTKGNSTTPRTGDQIAVIGWVIAGIVAAIVAVIAFRRLRRTDK